MARKQMKPVVAAIGAAMAGTLSLSAANAADNPFGLSELGSGYMQLAQAEGKCGEGKCGEGKCGGDNTPAEAEEAMTEGKCGEGKCGGDKTPAEAEKAATEGKCGEGKCGAAK